MSRHYTTLYRWSWGFPDLIYLSKVIYLIVIHAHFDQIHTPTPLPGIPPPHSVRKWSRMNAEHLTLINTLLSLSAEG